MNILLLHPVFLFALGHLPCLLNDVLLHTHIWRTAGRHVPGQVQDYRVHLHHLRAWPSDEDTGCCSHPWYSSCVSVLFSDTMFLGAELLYDLLLSVRPSVRPSVRTENFTCNSKTI